MSTVKKRIYVIIAAVLFVALLALEVFQKSIFTSEAYGQNLYVTLSRSLGGIVCVLFILAFSTKSILFPRLTLKTFLIFLPCMAVAINNFPFIPVFSGNASIDSSPSVIAVYALSQLAIGFFEEMAFRGCIFTVVLQRCKKNRMGAFFAIVISSVIFGVIHALNIFAGSNPGAVILQIGYSFLIGGMCSVILIKTSNIWYCVILHAVYNFAGGVVPNCGVGEIWDTPTVILTTVVALAVAAYVIFLLFTIRQTEIQRVLNDGEKEEQTNI
ncbi:MAG: CPBP family intramembrane metalloprotease [Ruminococcaceae bacterium]|nr:CPBP family intramembrane metalloprotease [Oscillospiraceae bacterium]